MNTNKKIRFNMENTSNEIYSLYIYSNLNYYLIKKYNYSIKNGCWLGSIHFAISCGLNPLYFPMITRGK